MPLLLRTLARSRHQKIRPPPMIDDAYRLLSRLGWPLIETDPGESKRPVVRDGGSWKDKANQVKLTRKLLTKAHKGKLSIAMCSPPDVVVLDIDHRKDLKAINREVGVELHAKTLTVETGAGFHLYFLLPEWPITTLKKSDSIYGRTDTRKNGYQLCPPSLHWQGKRYYKQLDNNHNEPAAMPKKLQKHYKKCMRRHLESKRKLTGDDAKAFVHNGEAYISNDKIQKILDNLNPENFRALNEEFFPLLSSIHHASAGNKEARDMFLEWAAGDNAYNNRRDNEANLRMWAACKL